MSEPVKWSAKSIYTMREYVFSTHTLEYQGHIYTSIKYYCDDVYELISDTKKVFVDGDWPLNLVANTG